MQKGIDFSAKAKEGDTTRKSFEKRDKTLPKQIMNNGNLDINLIHLFKPYQHQGGG